MSGYKRLSYIAAWRDFDFRRVKLLLLRHIKRNGRGYREIVVCLHCILFHKWTSRWAGGFQPAFGWDWCPADKKQKKVTTVYAKMETILWPHFGMKIRVKGEIKNIAFSVPAGDC